MKTIACVFGTRPEAIKMAPVILALRARPKEFRCKVIVTAQHRQMLDQVLKLFGIRSDHDLNVMREDQTLTEVTVRALARLAPVLQKEKPDLVLVHGDTTTTLAAALAAYYRGIPVGHVEAGLRSHDLLNPFPEEANRRLADALCALHFAPTPLAKQRLLSENASRRGIFVTGNTGIDALQTALRRMGKGAPRYRRPGRLVLVTAHRRENFGRPLQDFFRALRKVALSRPDVHFVYPVHPNPNVERPARKILKGLKNVRLLKPLDYPELIAWMRQADFVVTDSGGLQEEAPSLGKPVLVLRAVTERPEAVKAGTVQIIGTDTATVERWIRRLLDDARVYQRMANAVNPYGDGQAARRTVEAIRYHFGLRKDRPDEFRGGARKGSR